MAYHHFHIGQKVMVSEFSLPPGPFAITRLLPLAEGVPHYRVKSLVDGHERAVSERSLHPPPAPADSNDAPPPRPKASTR